MIQKYAVVVGSMNCDIIYLQDRLPSKGETLLARSASVTPGGKGANQAVQCAKLGIPTYMVAKTGSDDFGVFLRNELKGYGVDTSNIFVGEKMSGIAAVLTMTDGVYYSTVAPGSNYEITVQEIESIRSLIENATVAIFQNEITSEATERAMEIAHNKGVYIVYNAAPAKLIPEQCLSWVDCLIVNESEASFYLGKTINSVESAIQNYRPLLDRINGSLVITLGRHGSLLCNANGHIVYPADPGIMAVETTGSGDSYVGAYAFMKANGCNDEDACRFASMVSQYTVTKVGGQPSMPRWIDVAESWEKEKNRYSAVTAVYTKTYESGLKTAL